MNLLKILQCVRPHTLLNSVKKGEFQKVTRALRGGLKVFGYLWMILR